MYLQDILEVVIGLVFLWLVISLATMSFQEWIANAAKWRAKELEKAIAGMLRSRELTRQFYAYPLIADLYSQSKKSSKKTRLPANIPANKFSSTVFQLILQAGSDNSPIRIMTKEIGKKLVSIESPEHQQLAQEDWDTILETADHVASSGPGTAALDSLKYQLQTFGEKYPELKSTLETLVPQVDTYFSSLSKGQPAATGTASDAGLTMHQFRLGVQALQKVSPQLSKSITAILKQSDGYALNEEQVVATTRVNLETWFNDVMDRLSSNYKRRAQIVAFFIGLFLALMFNVDSINIANSLWREPTLRQAIIAQVQNFSIPQNSQDGSTTNLAIGILSLESQLRTLNIPFGWTTVAFDTGGRQCSLLPPKAGQVWGIPSQDSQGQPICKELSDLPSDVYGWLVRILGMLMTSVAAAQGAPFWFDIFKKALYIRSASTSTLDQQAVG